MHAHTYTVLCFWRPDHQTLVWWTPPPPKKNGWKNGLTGICFGIFAGADSALCDYMRLEYSTFSISGIEQSSYTTHAYTQTHFKTAIIVAIHCVRDWGASYSLQWWCMLLIHLSHWLPKQGNHPTRSWTLSGPPWQHKGRPCLLADPAPPSPALFQPSKKIEKQHYSDLIAMSDTSSVFFNTLYLPGSDGQSWADHSHRCRSSETQYRYLKKHRKHAVWKSSWMYTVFMNLYSELIKKGFQTHTSCTNV